MHVIPLLVETGQQDDFDLWWSSTSSRSARWSGCGERNGFAAEAEDRIDAQATRAERLASADIVLDNAGGHRRPHRSDRLWPGSSDLFGRLTMVEASCRGEPRA